MKFSSKFILLFLFALFAFSPVWAQSGDEPITVDTSIVRLNVGVVDRTGRPAMNLTQNDFTVYEDDVKQKITRFETTSAPFSLVVLLDVSGSTKTIRQMMAQAAARFVDALTPEDRVTVIAFNEEPETLTDFTTNRKDIVYAISLVASQKKGGSTMLYKALDFSLERLKKEGKRRKAIVVLTDGIDTELEAEDRRTVNKANAITAETAVAAIKPEQSSKLISILDTADKQGVTVYPLALPTGDPARIADPLPFQVAKYTAARERLQILATRTGGNLNAINRLEDMSRLYAAIAAELRTLYSVEYQPANEQKRDGKWSTIRIEVSQAELIAKTRPGYYAK